jgi:hypothetical protein
MKPLAQAKTVSRLWNTTKASTVLPSEFTYWNDNQSVISQSGDVCRIGSWVVVRPDPENNGFAIGRVTELLSPSVEESGPSKIPENLVTVTGFVLGDKRHSVYGMPVLRSTDTPTFLVVKTEVCLSYCTQIQIAKELEQAILFRISVQHDCNLHKCKPTGLRAIIQERIATEDHTNILLHEDDSHFVINLHALHNANLLRQVLPRSLTKPEPQHGDESDRKTWHAEVAVTLRERLAARNKRKTERRKATTVANKQKKAEKEAAMRAGQEVEEEEADSGRETGTDGGDNDSDMDKDEEDDCRPAKRKRT